MVPSINRGDWGIIGEIGESEYTLADTEYGMQKVIYFLVRFRNVKMTLEYLPVFEITRACPVYCTS